MHTERVRTCASTATRQSKQSFHCGRFILAVAILGASLALADPAAKKALFNIEAQPAETALMLYARQARVQLGFAADIVDDVLTNEVKGEYENAQALELLLEGTGLEAEHGERGIVIRRIMERTEANWAEASKAAIAETNALQLTQKFVQTNSQNRTEARDNATDQDSKIAPKESEEIVVTGSRIRAAHSVAPVIAITYEDIDRAGFATTEQLLDSLPQNFAGGANQENRSDWFDSTDVGERAGSEVSIDLRGLGPDSTLILVNGRRVSSGGFDGAFVDVSSIPITAIERVEVLTDGASAIYGADAIAGVVNFVLKDDYDGAETRLRYGAGAAFSDVRLGQVVGKTWDRGNLLFTYEYYHQDNLDTADRAVAASSDLGPLGGDDWSRVGGNPGTIIAGGESFAIPRGQDGTSLTSTDFTAGAQNFRNRREGQDLLGKQDRHSMMLLMHQDISDNLEYFFEGRYSEREATTRTYQSGVDLVVPDTNPFFVDPTGTGLTAIRIENYSFVRDIGPSYHDGDVATVGVTSGISFNFGGRWQVDVTGSYAKEETSGIFRNIVDTEAAAAAVAESDPERALNPFGDGSHTNPSVLDGLRASGVGSEVEQDLWNLHLGIGGDLFELPAGAVSLATGLEYRSTALKNANIEGPVPLIVVPGANSDRQVVAAYAEIFLPLVEPSAKQLGLHRLELSIAGRYEDYDDVGRSVNPKVGLLWSPLGTINIRGTVGTSFKAPLLTELNTTPSFTNFDSYVPAGFAPVPAIFIFGGNDTLSPEEATTWTAGLQFAPENSTLNAELTYFNIEIEDRVRRAAPNFFDVFDPSFASLVTLNPTQEEITAIANSPRYLDVLGVASAEDLIGGLVPVEAIVDFRLQNVAQAEVTGVDMIVTYSFESTAGQFEFGMNGSYLFNVEDTFLPMDPPIDRVNTVGNPVDLRLRSSLSWSHGNWGMSAFANYVGSYTNNERDPEEPIDSWTTVDLQVSYGPQERSTNSWLSNIRASLTIQNLFDEGPPFVNLSRGIGFDTANASAIGRFVALQITKEW